MDTFPTLPLAALASYMPLLGGALLLVLLDAFLPRVRPVLGPLAIACSLGATALLFLPGADAADPGGFLSGGALHRAFAAIAYVSSALSMALAIPYLRRSGLERAEFYALVLLSTAGMGMVAHSDHLAMLFVGVEVLTVPLYVLAGFFRTDERGVEAAAKYFLIGIFSSAFLTMGIALLYGASGTLDLGAIASGSRLPADAGGPLWMAALAMLTVGIGFKVASVPFHFWAPDVYEGAPTPVTALLATGSKAAGIALLLRVLFLGFPGSEERWIAIVSALTAACLVLANLTALLQENIKRMLAFSGISHMGFLLLAVLTEARMGGSGEGTSILLFYLVAYVLMNLGAWAAVAHLEGEYGKRLRLRDYAGLGTRQPATAAALGLCLLSLAGIPPTAGFVAKLALFYTAAGAGLWGLTTLALLMSVVAAAYYLRVIVYMYFRPADESAPRPAPVPVASGAVLLVAVLGTFWIGVLPQGLLDWLYSLRFTP